jgi:hypothetical protein
MYSVNSFRVDFISIVLLESGTEKEKHFLELIFCLDVKRRERTSLLTINENYGLTFSTTERAV